MASGESMTGASYDTLVAGNIAPFLYRNLPVDSGVTVERGMLLACSLGETKLRMATASDALDSPSYYIGARDETAGATLTTVFSAGTFNRSGIKLSEGLKIEDYEAELRRQNIWLTEEL